MTHVHRLLCRLIVLHSPTPVGCFQVSCPVVAWLIGEPEHPVYTMSQHDRQADHDEDRFQDYLVIHACDQTHGQSISQVSMVVQGLWSLSGLFSLCGLVFFSGLLSLTSGLLSLFSGRGLSLESLWPSSVSLSLCLSLSLLSVDLSVDLSVSDFSLMLSDLSLSQRVSL